MIKKNRLVFSFFILIFFILSINTLRDLSFSYPTEYGVYTNEIQDEYHTLVLGTRELLGEKNQINRVGSFSRLTVKLLSPVGVLYMNNNLGGEHHVTLDNQHNYSGYSYLNRNFVNAQNILQDPNIQNYRLGILFARNALFITVLISISYILFVRGRKLSSVFILIAILTSASYNIASPILYTDFSNLLILCLFFLIFLTESLNPITKNLLAIFFAAALISNGLSNIIFLPLIFTIFKVKKLKYLAIYLICFIGIFYLLNINELSDPINYLDSQLWNLYHYQTGHYLIEPVGISMLMKILKFGFPWVGSFVLLILFKFIDKEDKKLFVFLCITQILILLSSSQLRVFVDRNYAGLIVLGIFITSLTIKGLEKNIKTNILNYQRIVFIVLIAFALYPFFRDDNFNYRIENTLTDIGCENILAINTSKSEININKTDYIKVEITETVEAPEYFKTLEELVQPYDCLIVSDVFESKNISTFVAPQIFNLGNRTDKFLLFYK